MLSNLSNVVRFEGDPKVVQSGPSSLRAPDRLARGLGWFSLGLGLAELMAPQRFTRALGMEGHETLVRAYGVREMGAGVLTLSVDKQAGLWSRVGGDGLDIVTLLGGLRRDNPMQRNVATALFMVLGITLLDLFAAQTTTATHARRRGRRRLYQDRSGFPKGLEAAKQVAKHATQSLAPARAKI